MSVEPHDSSTLARPPAITDSSVASSSGTSLTTASAWDIRGAQHVTVTTAARVKKARPKPSEDTSQGRLSFGKGNGGWSIDRSEAGSSPVAGADRPVADVARKGKGLGAAEAAEQAEVKEMARRAKAAEKEAKAAEKEAKAAEKQAQKEAKAADKEKQRQERAAAKEREKAEGKKRRSRAEGEVDDSVRLEVCDLTGPSPAARASTTPSPARKRSRPQIFQGGNRAGPGSGNGVRPDSSPSDIVVTGSTLRPPHPFFGRSGSTVSSGASHDPIPLDVSPPAKSAAAGGPKKLFFAADRHPVHAFFSHANPSATSAAPSMSRTTSATSQATTEAGRPDKGKKKALHVFFGGNDGQAAPLSSEIRPGWGRGIKAGEEALAPLPRGSWPSHCGHGELLQEPTYFMSRKRKRPSCLGTADGESINWHSIIDLSATPLPVNGNHASSSTTHSGHLPMLDLHPVFQSTHAKRTSRQATWAEKYRPSRSDGILGNELEASYLRHWLRALEVGNPASAGRKVHRKARRLQKELIDGWIVDDADLLEDPEDDADDKDPYEEYEEPELAIGERPDEYPALAARLTNCILLAGPHGVGKSAAVYTAAEELGWEVFEVYPGMGKRTAANLMSWVGDVGTNHMVIKGNGTKGDTVEIEHVAEISSFFGKHKAPNGNENIEIVASPPPKRKKQRKNVILSSSQGSEKDPIDVMDEDENGNDVVLIHNKMPPEAVARQSLILIDEADILFAEENTFWPAIISLIAESRRPVIITCNDRDQIPLQQLPFQAILHFQPPPPWLAIPYLASVAAKEGIAHPLYASELYHRCLTNAPEVLHQPVAPNGNEWLPSFDLRRALMQIQLDRAHVAERQELFEVDTSDLQSLYQCLDVASFADAWVTTGPADVIEICEVDRDGPTIDDQLGVRLLPKAAIDEFRPVLAGFDCADAIGDALSELAGGRAPPLAHLDVDRIQHVRSLLPALDPLVPLNSYLLPHPSLFLDYMPIVRSMVETDDLYEAEEAAAIADGGSRLSRKTGRPKRSVAVGGSQPEFERYLDLDASAVQGVRDSRLDWC